MPTAENLIREYEQLKGLRGTWENHWQEVARVVLPRYDSFTDHMVTKGEKKTQDIFDSSPVQGLNRFSSAMTQLIAPQAQTWHNLKSNIDELNENSEVKEWFDEVNRILFRARYSARANFGSQLQESLLQLGAFGTAVLFIDENLLGGIRYKAIHLAELFFATDHQGNVNKVYRKFKLNAHQANKFPEWQGRLPEKISKASNAFQEFEFMHVVMPREDYDPTRVDAVGKKWVSYYVSLEGKVMLSEGGYREMPYAISRYNTTPNEVYGRSPAMEALADIKTLNRQMKDHIDSVHRTVNPAILAYDDGLMGGGSMNINLRPNAINYGGISMDGRQLIQPFNSGNRVDINEALLEQRRTSINDSFLVSLFQILADNPQMTATEVMIRAQEKAALIGPSASRQQSELLGPMVERELDILMSQFSLPPMPQELLEAEGEYEIVYDAPINRMQRSEEAIGMARTLEFATPFIQVKPNLINLFDAEESIRMVADINGVPAKALVTREEFEEMMEADAQAAEQQQMVEQMQPAATAAKDVAQAQALLREPAA